MLAGSTKHRDLVERIEKLPAFGQLEHVTPFAIEGLYSLNDPDTLIAFADKCLDKVVQSEPLPSQLDRSTIDGLFKAAQNKKVVAHILATEKVPLMDLTGGKLIHWMARFAELERPTLTQAKLLIGILSKNSARLSAARLTDMLFDCRELVRDMAANDPMLTIATMRLLREASGAGTEVSILELVRLSKLVEEGGHRSDILLDMISNQLAAEKDMPIGRLITVAGYLATHERLRLDQAVELLCRVVQQPKYNASSCFRVACMALGHPKASEEARQAASAVVKRHLEHLEKDISDSEPRRALKYYSDYFYLPANEIEPIREKLEAGLKDHLAVADTSVYVDLISNLSASNIRKHFDAYLPLLRVLAGHFSAVKDSLRGNQVVTLLQGFAGTSLQMPGLYSQIIELLGKNFSSLRRSELLAVADSLSSLGFKQSDVFDKIFESLLEEDSQQRLTNFEIDTLLRAFFRVGLDSRLAREKSDSLFLAKGRSSTCTLDSRSRRLQPAVSAHPGARQRSSSGGPGLF
jgi:hypothetical protein